MTKPQSLLIALSATALVAGIVIVAGLFYRRPTVTERLPAPSELHGASPELLARVQQASAKATSPATTRVCAAELGALFHANGFFAEARRCWTLLQQHEPREARWAYLLADLDRLSGDDAAMAAQLARAAQLAPNYAPVWLRLADWEFKRGQLADAARDYRRRLELLPGDPYARLGLVRIALQQAENRKARDELEQLVHDAPAFPTAHNLLAEQFAAAGDTARADKERRLGTEAGRFREAEDPWIDALIDECYDYDRLCFAGTKEVLVGNRDRAKTLFERAASLRPDAPAAYDLLGSFYADANDLEHARQMFERAIAVASDAPVPAKTYVSLARMYRLSRQPERAIGLLRDAVARLGPRPEFDEALGMAFSESGKNEDAIAALSRAVSADPKNATWHYELAVELLNAGRPDEGKAALRASLAAEPALPAALGLFAQLEIEAGHWAEAVRYLAPLFEANPDVPDAREKMAYAYLRAGDEAATTGDVAAAQHYYRSGLAIDRENAELQTKLEALLRRLAARQ